MNALKREKCWNASSSGMDMRKDEAREEEKERESRGREEGECSREGGEDRRREEEGE